MFVATVRADLTAQLAPYQQAILVYVGIALVANTAWPLLLLPGVLLATHVVVVPGERFLEGRFGAVYRSYKTSVRRYL